MPDDVLIEQDPELDGIVDKASQRDLLKDTAPLVIAAPTDKPHRFILEIRNGQKGLIDIAVSSDEPWLRPETTRLTLVGGESGDCILSVVSEGEAEYANLLLSWEGVEQTRCDSVMVVRELPSDKPPAQESSGPKPASPKPTPPPTPKPKPISEPVQALVKFIDGCGGPDKFIDTDEENRIFRKGGGLGLEQTQTESALNQRCAEGGWTRQYRLTEKLTAMLHEATKDDGVIDQQEFDHCVNFAIKRFMPRKDALEHCVTLILDNAWRAKETMFNKWFTKLCKQFGLR